MTPHHRRHMLRALLLLLALALVTLASSLALVPTRTYQGADTAAYAYVAQVMLDGGIPYRDARESKPPLTFALNAAAMTLLGVDYWTLWWLRVVTVIVTGVLFVGLLRDLQLAHWLAWLGAFCLVLLLTRPVWADTNTPELYALPFQILALRAGFCVLAAPGSQESRHVAGHLRGLPVQDSRTNGVRANARPGPHGGRHRHGLSPALLTGLAGGMALLGKQTSGGVLVAFVLALLIARVAGWRRLRWRPIPLVVAGALLPLLIVALWLAAHDALHDAYDSVIRYNRYYNVGPLSLTGLVRSALTENDAVAPIALPLGAFVVLGALSVWRPPRDVGPAQRALRLFVVLTMLLDVLLANLTQEGFAHYFLTPLPAFMALVMAGLGWLLRYPWQQRVLRATGWISVVYVALGVVLLPNVLYVALVLSVSDGDLRTQAVPRPLTDYVRRHTAPDDTVQVWGYNPAVNLLSKRRSPSPTFYPRFLTLPGYSGPARIASFVDDLRANHPALIVDISLTANPDLLSQKKVPPLDPAQMGRFYANGGLRDLPDITPVRGFVAARCTTERRLLISTGPVTIYRCTYD